ncbi:fatty acid hydroxylase family protein [Rhodospirillaceae bacterium RKSG073]|nr:fatty acid hydroxylase family protein [Curvivirga aplysinae]
MFWPACFFFLLALILKQGKLLSDIQKAAKETSLNLQLILFNAVIVAPIIAFSLEGFEFFFRHQQYAILTRDHWMNLPIPIIIFFTIFIGDFVGYWRHRLEHTIPLWPSHAVHHSDTQMTWLTLERFHPINRLTTFLIDTGILLFLGIPPFAIIINNMVRHYYGYFIHADLPWTYGNILGKIFVSPTMHRWHHSADPKYFQCNFATIFAIFDWAFGTYKLPGPCNSPLGIADKIPTRLSNQILYAFKPSSYSKLIRYRFKKLQSPKF